MPKKPELLHDPPEVRQFAKRGDPPMAAWPGVPVNREALMRAGGDPRDWFRYMHRLRACERAWAEFVDARERRTRFDSNFDWNQILILGDYGAGKTTLATKMALEWFRLGHAVFSNASCLFGWHLEHEDMYTAMGFMPANSVLLIDESSAALASRVGHGVSVSTFNEMNLNTRKRNSIVVYMSAQDWEIAGSIRRNCREVWMPVPKDDIDANAVVSPTGKRIADANNPDNFRLAWHVWDDYPYRKANIIEGKVADEGFGPPTYTMFDEGENVRNAFLLNDTFELAAAGAATISDRDVVKDQLRAFRAGTGPIRRNGGAADPRWVKLLTFFEQHVYDPPEYFTASEIGRAIGLDASPAARYLRSQIDVASVQGKGYSSQAIYDHLEARLAAVQTEAA